MCSLSWFMLIIIFNSHLLWRLLTYQNCTSYDLMTVIVNFLNMFFTLQFGSKQELVKCTIVVEVHEWMGNYSFLPHHSFWSILWFNVSFCSFFLSRIFSALVGYAIPDWHGSWWDVIWTGFKSMTRCMESSHQLNLEQRNRKSRLDEVKTVRGFYAERYSWSEQCKRGLLNLLMVWTTFRFH